MHPVIFIIWLFIFDLGFHPRLALDTHDVTVIAHTLTCEPIKDIVASKSQTHKRPSIMGCRCIHVLVSLPLMFRQWLGTRVSGNSLRDLPNTGGQTLVISQAVIHTGALARREAGGGSRGRTGSAAPGSRGSTRAGSSTHRAEILGMSQH